MKNESFYIWLHEGPPRFFFKTEESLPNNIIFGKISLDFQFISLQISPTKLVVIGITSKKRWNIDIKYPEDNFILGDGLIWSEHGGNSQDLIIVTFRGLELYKISASRGQCKLSRIMAHNEGVAYFWYEPNHRMILLASPTKLYGNNTTSAIISASAAAGVSFAGNKKNKSLKISLSDSNNELLKMNGYFFRSEISDIPKLELPPPEKVPSFDLGK